MSGRSLRRLPVLAHARYIGTQTSLGPVRSVNTRPMTNGINRGIGAETDVFIWLDAMERVVESQRQERGRLEK